MLSRYWRHASFYFFYFASLGALLPFWSVYLDELGFDAWQIGLLISTLSLSKVVAPYLLGWVADHSGFHIRIVRISSLLALLLFLPLLSLQHFWWMLILMFAFSFFWNAAIPQFEVVTLAHLGDEKHRYSQIRLWGSLGFILCVSLIGFMLSRFSVTTLPLMVLLILAGIVMSSFLVGEVRTRQPRAVHIWQVLKRPEVMAMLLCVFFLQLSHGAYYTFFSLHLQQLDYSRLQIGLLWSLGVAAEVLLFVRMPKLLQLRSAAFWLWVAGGLTLLRWLLMAYFSQYVAVVVFAQLLHAASFGVFHAASIQLVHEFFPSHQGRGQALYSSLSFGAGGALGSLYAGAVWDDWHAQGTFFSAAVLALIGWLFASRLLIPSKAGSGR